MIDSLLYFLPTAQKSQIGKELGLFRKNEWRQFAVLTLHRPSNVDTRDKLKDLLGAVDSIAALLPVIFPVHPRTLQQLDRTGISHHPELRVIQPLGYLDFLCLMSRATLVLTDSGGIQEETTALGVPCLTLRDNTERPITVTQGTNVVVGTDPRRIVAGAHKVLANKCKPSCIPPLWDGHAAERIVAILCKHATMVCSRSPKRDFGHHRKSEVS